VIRKGRSSARSDKRDRRTLRLLADGDPNGLRRLLRDHGGTVRARLQVDFGKVFDQYLRTTDIPELVHETKGDSVTVWFEKVVPGFRVPVVLTIDGKERRVTVGTEPVEIATGGKAEDFALDRNFYMTVRAK